MNAVYRFEVAGLVPAIFLPVIFLLPLSSSGQALLLRLRQGRAQLSRVPVWLHGTAIEPIKLLQAYQ